MRAESFTPSGFHYEWFADRQWTTDASIVSEKRCRMMTGPGKIVCTNPAVAAFRRGRSGWWCYCEDHLYGRRLRDGVVEGQRLVPDVVGIA